VAIDLDVRHGGLDLLLETREPGANFAQLHFHFDDLSLHALVARVCVRCETYTPGGTFDDIAHLSIDGVETNVDLILHTIKTGIDVLPLSLKSPVNEIESLLDLLKPAITLTQLGRDVLEYANDHVLRFLRHRPTPSSAWS
jgi:hypothetical protein